MSNTHAPHQVGAEWSTRTDARTSISNTAPHRNPPATVVAEVSELTNSGAKQPYSRPIFPDSTTPTPNAQNTFPPASPANHTLGHTIADALSVLTW
ncbi:hypothetical protein [Rhodococcus sp. UFZ-B548]|uniref:hypothetical protein n=1 Tax=Rhodococcus sp. UFZ-B548 TaxID=2742212 RepID=UPI00217531C4|nr:hypothetical protein [Rhodococcus sp. UFZ-B548]